MGTNYLNVEVSLQPKPGLGRACNKNGYKNVPAAISCGGDRLGGPGPAARLPTCSFSLTSKASVLTKVPLYNVYVLIGQLYTHSPPHPFLSYQSLQF